VTLRERFEEKYVIDPTTGAPTSSGFGKGLRPDG